MDKLQELEALKNVRVLLANGWTQGNYARAANGIPVSATSSDAVCWCLLGAGAREGIEADEMGRLMAGCLPRVSAFNNAAFNVVEFNDNSGTTKEEVLKAVDCAITNQASRVADL